MDDHDRLKRLFDSQYERLVRTLSRMTGDHARDVAQEAFIKIGPKLGGIAEGAEKSYLFRIGRNLALNWIRDAYAAGRDERLTDPLEPEKHDLPLDSPEDLLVRREQTEAVRKQLRPVIAGLRPLVRDIFLLRLEGRMPREIVRLLGVKLSVVTESLREARRRIRESVGELPDGIDWTALTGEDDE